MSEIITKTIYICPKCSNYYTSDEEANKCMSSHKVCKEISNVEYAPHTAFPQQICVEFEDGSTAWYKRMT